MRERKSEYVNLARLAEDYRRPGDEQLIDARPAVRRMLDEQLILCRSCGHEYMEGRPRCSACGTTTPTKKREPRFRNTARIRVVSQTACIECKQRGAKIECEHCGHLVHPGCFTLHICKGVNISEGEDQLDRPDDAERPAFTASSDAVDGRRAS